MFLPIKTDCPPRKPPVVNYIIIVINILIFIALNYFISHPSRTLIYRKFMLDCNSPIFYQFLTYAFLHADWSHLLGNMLFLYIFGNSLNDKLGHLEYLLFYLSAAIITGAGYALTSSVSLLGASGAIAATTTGFLIFFPRSRVLMLYWILFLIGTIEIPSIYIILFKMILVDNIIIPAISSYHSPIAYGAHLIGYTFGIILPLVLLAIRAVERDQFDLLAVVSRIFKRRKFRKVTQKTGGLFYKDTLKPKIESHPKFKAVKVKNVEDENPITDQKLLIKQEIMQSLRSFDIKNAIQKYNQLIQDFPDEVLPEKYQLDIANQMMADGDYSHSAQAYEKFIQKYPKSEQVDQVKLLLGVIYSRYTSNPRRAKELLEEIKDKLKDPKQRQLCLSELEKLK